MVSPPWMEKATASRPALYESDAVEVGLFLLVRTVQPSKEGSFEPNVQDPQCWPSAVLQLSAVVQGAVQTAPEHPWVVLGGAAGQHVAAHARTGQQPLTPSHDVSTQLGLH